MRFVFLPNHPNCTSLSFLIKHFHLDFFQGGKKLFPPLSCTSLLLIKNFFREKKINKKPSSILCIQRFFFFFLLLLKKTIVISYVKKLKDYSNILSFIAIFHYNSKLSYITWMQKENKQTLIFLLFKIDLRGTFKVNSFNLIK